jgi:hypothetical protein
MSKARLVITALFGISYQSVVHRDGTWIGPTEHKAICGRTARASASRLAAARTPSTGSSLRVRRTGSGAGTRPRSLPGRASCTWPPCSTCTRAGCSATP